MPRKHVMRMPAIDGYAVSQHTGAFPVESPAPAPLGLPPDEVSLVGGCMVVPCGQGSLLEVLEVRGWVEWGYASLGES